MYRNHKVLVLYEVSMRLIRSWVYFGWWHVFLLSCECWWPELTLDPLAAMWFLFFSFSISFPTKIPSLQTWVVRVSGDNSLRLEGREDALIKQGTKRKSTPTAHRLQPLARIYQAFPSGAEPELGSAVRSHRRLNVDKTARVKWVIDHRCVAFRRGRAINLGTRSSARECAVHEMGKQAFLKTWHYCDF